MTRFSDSKFCGTLWLLILLALPILAEETQNSALADGVITADEREELLALLEEGYSEFLLLVEGMDDRNWNRKPGADRWSTRQVAEHLVLSEQTFFSRATQALKQPVDPEWASRAEHASGWIPVVVPDRSRTGQAPPEIQPQSVLGRKEILEKFATLRNNTIDFVRSSDQPMKTRTLTIEGSPFGPLSSYHWLLFMAHHTARHNQQIQEIQAAL